MEIVVTGTGHRAIHVYDNGKDERNEAKRSTHLVGGDQSVQEWGGPLHRGQSTMMLLSSHFLVSSRFYLNGHSYRELIPYPICLLWTHGLHCAGSPILLHNTIQYSAVQ